MVALYAQWEGRSFPHDLITSNISLTSRASYSGKPLCGCGYFGIITTWMDSKIHHGHLMPEPS